MSIFKRIVSKIKYQIAVSNSDRYVNYLRDKGIRIGGGYEIQGTPMHPNRHYTSRTNRNWRTLLSSQRADSYDA